LVDLGEYTLFLLTPVVNYIFLDHVLHGLNYLHIIQDELSEEVYLAQEVLHGFLVDWVRNLCNGLNQVWIHLDPTLGNNVSKEVPLRQCKYALFGIQGNPISSASLKDFP